VLQIAWFNLGCLLAALIAGCLFYACRLKCGVEIIQDRLEARYLERLRIARDLDDTLIQAVQGLTLRIQAISGQMAGNDALTAEVEGVLVRADDLLVDARDRVRDLRAELEGHCDLADSFSGFIKSPPYPFFGEVELKVEGEPQTIPLEVCDELLSIGKEALGNAFRHAGAAHVRARIAYDSRMLRLFFCDDGAGIDADVLARGCRPGHWGLPGIRERAHSLGATMKIQSAPAKGTVIEVAVPGRIAYSVYRRRRFLNLLQWIWKPL
jgi:signal transduction histidine kinase